MRLQLSFLTEIKVKCFSLKNSDLWLIPMLLRPPAGLIDPEEDPVTTAVRELKEETGYIVRHVDVILPASYSSIGLTDEATTSVFVRVDEHQVTESKQEATEDITYFWITKDEAAHFFKWNKLPKHLQEKLNLPDEPIGITARTQLVLMQFITTL